MEKGGEVVLGFLLPPRSTDPSYELCLVTTSEYRTVRSTQRRLCLCSTIHIDSDYGMRTEHFTARTLHCNAVGHRTCLLQRNGPPVRA
jgi:hypothetical protein